MSDEVFCHGRAGQWIFTITDVRHADSTISASADISSLGVQRCRLVLSQRNSSRDALVELMRAKCVAWIDSAEASLQQPFNETAAELTRELQARSKSTI